MARNAIAPYLLKVLGHNPETVARLITANQDPQQFLQDWIGEQTRPEALWSLSRLLESLTVLDPTCGTGAFLIAALNVLHSIRSHCLERMALLGVKELSCRPKQMGQQIIEQNLFGIDLLPEAVELCRLRLRLEAGTEIKDNLRVGNMLLDETARPQAAQTFDIILGNPPYLELREVDYRPQGFRCQETGAVHALCVERSLELMQPHGWMSMIVPLSLVSTQRMKCVQDLLEEGRHVWYANFSWRPGRLFANVNRAMTLFVTTAADRPRTWTTGYQKWRTHERDQLMGRIRYVETPRNRLSFWVPKLSQKRERSLLDRLLRVPTTVEDFLAGYDTPNSRIWYRTDGGLYWKVFSDFAPSFSCNGQLGHSTRETWVTVAKSAHVAPLIAALSSDLFWWWYTITSNCRHLNPVDIHRFPLPASVLEDASLRRLGRAYLRDIVRHSAPHTRRQRQTGWTRTQSFKIRKSRPLLLAIGETLARHYGLTNEQRNFLASYDLSFRMGED
jgi:hypothetical protein